MQYYARTFTYRGLCGFGSKYACASPSNIIFRFILNLNTKRNSLVFFQYWHDPIHFDQYLEKSQFIADINNERPMKNETYKENLIKLENLVLVKNLDVSVCIALTYIIRKVYSS